MLAVQVVCDVLNRDMEAVHTVNGSGEAIVAHLEASRHNVGHLIMMERKCSSQRLDGASLTSVPCDRIITTQQSNWVWSFLDKVDSSCLICCDKEKDVSAVTTNTEVGRKKKTSYPLF